jgi:hypothetical protein
VVIIPVRSDEVQLVTTLVGDQRCRVRNFRVSLRLMDLGLPNLADKEWASEQDS